MSKTHTSDKKRFRHIHVQRPRSLAAIGLATLVSISACTTTPQDGDTILRFADGYAATHPVSLNGSNVFVEEIRENGPDVGLEIEFYTNTQLGKWEDSHTLVSTGIADISSLAPSYLSETMPMSSAFDLPGYTSDSCDGARAVSRVASEGSTLRSEELDKLDVQPLWSGFLPAYEAVTSNETVEPLEQAGAVLRSPGGSQDRVVAAMGAAGVAMPMADMYEAVSRGTVEGTVASPISMAPYGLSEVLSHSTVGADLGSVSVLYSMSNQKWEQLDDSQREVVTAAAEKAEQTLCEELNAELPKALDEMEEDGTTLNTLTPEQQDRWQAEVSEPARENWQSDLEDMGLPAGDVLAEFEEALKYEGVSVE